MIRHAWIAREIERFSLRRGCEASAVYKELHFDVLIDLLLIIYDIIFCCDVDTGTGASDTFCWYLMIHKMFLQEKEVETNKQKGEIGKKPTGPNKARGIGRHATALPSCKASRR
jgi:hypothetical protein